MKNKVDLQLIYYNIKDQVRIILKSYYIVID